jgi:hypothetical protein
LQNWLHSDVIDTAEQNDTAGPGNRILDRLWLPFLADLIKIGKFVVDFLHEFEAIFKKALIYVPGA